MTAKTLKNAALVFASLTKTYAATCPELAERTGVPLGSVKRVLGALAKRGFVFCHDHYYDDADGNRQRKKNGRYTFALWCLNFEGSEITVEQATEAISTEGDGHTIMCDMGLGC